MRRNTGSATPEIRRTSGLPQARRLARHHAEELDPAVLQRRMLTYDTQHSAFGGEPSRTDRAVMAGHSDVAAPVQRSSTGSVCPERRTDCHCAVQLTDIAAQLVALTQAVHLIGGSLSRRAPHDGGPGCHDA